MRPSSSVLSFTTHVFSVVSKTSPPYSRTSKFSPVIFLQFYNFMFISGSVMESELIFVKDIRSVSTFIFFFLARGCSVVPAPFVEKTLRSIVLPLRLCQRSATPCLCGSPDEFLLSCLYSLV